jgi:hypothetical protein
VDRSIVELVGEGTGRCDGWTLATAGGVTSWVSSALIAPLA